MKKWLFVFILLFSSFFSKHNYEAKALNVQTYTARALLDDPTYIAFVIAVAVDVVTCVGNDAVNTVTSGLNGDISGFASNGLNTVGDLVGNGCHKKLAKGIFGCDTYEDVGLLDSITEIAGKTKKSRVCAANTITKQILRGAGAIVGMIWMGGCAICGEMAGNALSILSEMITIKAKYKGALKISEKYEVCLNEDPEADGRPMPYTDSQIIKLLKLAGEIPSIENIVDKYNKLCIHDLENDSYVFKKKDSVIDNIYITHMTGYSYVYCASVFSACPCIYNLQHGNVDEPEYEYDENGVIKVDEETGQLAMINKEDYQQHYAKHCRIIRYKDLYEQTNDLLPVFGDACYDNHGYSKTNIPLSSAFVQCIEDTAKNIFEKPVFSSHRTTTPSNDMIAVYARDITYVQKKYENLKKLIQGRTLESVSDDIEVGLYDKVNDKFYTNKGAGKFEKGGDVDKINANYTAIDYIESTGTQYIDTGAPGNSVYGIEFEYLPISKNQTDQDSIISGTLDNATFGMYNDINHLYLRWNKKDDYVGEQYPTVSTTDKNYIEVIQGKYYINGTEQYDVGEVSFSNDNNNIYIFNNFALNRGSKIKLYSLKLYDENGNLIRDFIPAYRKKGNDIPFRQDELDAGLAILQSIYYTNSSSDFQTYALEYNCKEGQEGKYTTTKHTTDIYSKYIDGSVVKHATPNCCYTTNDEVNNAETCFSNQLKQDYANFSTGILKDTKSITASTLINETQKVETLINLIAEKQSNASIAFSKKMAISEGTSWTLFDLFRVKIKALAVVALTLWFFILGWKLLNGEYGEIKQEEIAKLILKVVLCYFMVFNDNMKNFVFNWMINATNGIGMIINETLSSLRAQNDNTFGGKCNFHISNQTVFARYNDTGIVFEAERTEKETKKDSSGEIYHSYNFNCPVNSYTYEIDKEGRRKTVSSAVGLGTYNIGNLYEGEHEIQDINGNNVAITDQDFNLGGFGINLNFWSETSFIDDCVEYDKHNECIKKNCHVYENSNCSGITTSDGAGYDFVCNRYHEITDNEGIKHSICIDGSCKLNRTTYIPRPPFERPYKYFQFHDSDKGVEKILHPHCHRVATPNEIDDSGLKKVYSYTLNDYVYVCTQKDTEMDPGYRIQDLIDIGLLDPDPSSIRLFKGLLSEEQQESLNDIDITTTQKADGTKIQDTALTTEIKKLVIPTAVATTNAGGIVKEIDFSSGNKSTTGFQRQQYQKYLTSRLAYVNKGSNYPVFKLYGLTRNYNYVSMWDMADCKLMQYLTFSASGGSLGSSIEETLKSATTTGVSEKTIKAAGAAFIEMLKYIFIAFPFGAICFIISMIIGFMLFLLIARAAQQYAMCIFNLVCVMYLSPFVFVLYLFNQTEGAMDEWLGKVRKNICGACVPFISISIFLVIIDWIFFGDPAKYKEQQLFLSNGIVNPKCYEGNLSSAPIACLSVRLLNKYSLNGAIFEMLFGWFIAIFQKETWTLALYLLLKLLIGVATIIMLTQSLDQIEQKIYDLLGGKPDTDIGMGFEGSAKDAITDGAKAGWEVFKATGGAPYKALYNRALKPLGNKIKGLFGGNGKNGGNGENGENEKNGGNVGNGASRPNEANQVKEPTSSAGNTGEDLEKQLNTFSQEHTALQRGILQQNQQSSDPVDSISQSINHMIQQNQQSSNNLNDSSNNNADHGAQNIDNMIQSLNDMNQRLSAKFDEVSNSKKRESKSANTAVSRPTIDNPSTNTGGSDIGGSDIGGANGG